MQNVADWTPTKYEVRKGKLRASRNQRHVSLTSRLYADLTASFYDKYIRRFVKGHLADLGCGNVPLFTAYQKFTTQITCVDWSNTLHQNKFVDVPADLNVPLPFESELFDTLIISDVLEHIAEPNVIWSEMARVLKRHGHILISVPFFYRIHEAPYDYYRYTEFALKNFASKNRLEVIVLEAIGGFPEVITDIFAKNIVRLPFAGNLLARVSQGACMSFIRTSVGKRMSDKSKPIFPLGYFMVVKKV